MIPPLKHTEAEHEETAKVWIRGMLIGNNLGDWSETNATTFEAKYKVRTT